MCLSIPGEVISIDGNRAVVDISGVQYNAGLHLVENVHVGDHVLLHAGYVLQKLEKQEAKEMAILFEQLEEAMRHDSK